MLAHIVGEAPVPHRHQPLDVRFVNLLERAVLLQVIAHAEIQHVVRALAVVDQILGGWPHANPHADDNNTAANRFFIIAPPVKLHTPLASGSERLILRFATPIDDEVACCEPFRIASQFIS